MIDFLLPFCLLSLFNRVYIDLLVTHRIRILIVSVKDFSHFWSVSLSYENPTLVYFLEINHIKSIM